MTVIENNGTTMLVRLSADEIRALKRQIDGRSLNQREKDLIREIHFDLGRFEGVK